MQSDKVLCVMRTKPDEFKACLARCRDIVGYGKFGEMPVTA
jgi:hypothetical protein